MSSKSRASRLLLAVFLLLPASAAWATDATPSNLPESGGASLATATFSMYCYWTGEATLGGVDGVVASRIGHWGGDEIVQVDYDPQRTDLETLITALERRRSFDAVVVADRSEIATVQSADADAPVEVHRGAPHFIPPKHSLRTVHPELMDLDLTETQAIALNHWSYFGGRMPNVLTAEQTQRLRGEPGAP